MPENDFRTRNIFLGKLDPGSLAALWPHLRRMPLQRDQHLAAPGQLIDTVYFPEGGVVSCVATDKGSKTEVGLIGREGFTGIGALLSDGTAQFETFVQVGGSTALAIPIAELQRVAASAPALRQAVNRFASCFLLQVAYSLVSSSQHMMESRLARWLLMCHDRLEGDEIPLTHELMAMMISAQRSGVTVTLHMLEGAGMIRSTRGLATIRERPKLLALAGSAYGVPEARYRALIGPFGKSPEPHVALNPS